MLCGIGPYEIRLLCDDPWEGGRGMSLSDVAEMSLDQIFMLLTDRSILKSKGIRTKSYTPSETTALIADKDGYLKGRAANGTPIKAKMEGKSVARRLREEAEERKRKEKENKGKSKRQLRSQKRQERAERRKHGN